MTPETSLAFPTTAGWRPHPRYPTRRLKLLIHASSHTGSSNPPWSASTPAAAGQMGQCGLATAATCCGATSPTIASSSGKKDRHRQRVSQTIELRQWQHLRPAGASRDLRARRAAGDADRVRRHTDSPDGPVARETPQLAQ